MTCHDSHAVINTIAERMRDVGQIPKIVIESPRPELPTLRKRYSLIGLLARVEQYVALYCFASTYYIKYAIMINKPIIHLSVLQTLETIYTSSTPYLPHKSKLSII